MNAIYYRSSLTPNEEVMAIRRHFARHSDALVGLADVLVVGRYSVLPFYADVEREFALQRSRLINTYRQHRYIADFEWYEELRDLTPETWFRLADVPKNDGPFVLKGRTNSRKHNWNTHMFAATFQEAVEVDGRLRQDSLIGSQDIVVRRYVPLRVLEVGINGLPFANEWRCFFLGERLLSTGFYWTTAEVRGTLTAEGLEFARQAARRIAPHVNFFAIDVAETERGDWIVIEVNDGQMAGLSDNDPDTLYGNLAAVLQELDRLGASVPGGCLCRSGSAPVVSGSSILAPPP